MPVEPIYTNPRTPAHVRATLAALKRTMDTSMVTEEELEDTLEALRWKQATASEAISAGDVVYLDSPGNVSKARADNQLDADGVAVENISVGTTGFYAYGWFLSEFSSLTPGSVYFLSGLTAGAVVSSPDLETQGASVIIVGRAVSATELWIDIQPGILL